MVHDADKSGVEPRWGGKRRVLTLRLVELDVIKQIPEGNEKDLKQFTELLHSSGDPNRCQPGSRTW